MASFNDPSSSRVTKSINKVYQNGFPAGKNRTRRGPRYNKSKVKQENQSNKDAYENLIDEADFSSNLDEDYFSIQPIQGKSTFFHQRNANLAPVKLATFLESHTQIPVVFCSASYLVTQRIENRLEKLSISTNSASKNQKATLNVQSAGKAERTRRKKEQKQAKCFAEYISEDEVEAGLAAGVLFKGFIRVNPKNSREAYMGNDDSSQIDHIITTVEARNRALDGDQVVISPKPGVKEAKRSMQVVYITKKVHPRISVGFLEPHNAELAVLRPRDSRVPKILIPKISWPNGFAENSSAFAHVLCVAKIIDWTDIDFATGSIIEILGKRADLTVESVAILKEFCLDTSGYGPEFRRYLPKSDQIPPEEYAYRADLRNECIFTIDPLTARDLDDAVSCKLLANGNYEVGVHISDAAYYLAENTALDEKVREKATSIYMVDTCYHMLPLELCLHCSLLPGKDKLAFSVILEMTEAGVVVSKRITRSVINSCAQLAYEHAQLMIDNPKKTFELPKIYNNYTENDLKATVLNLQKIAINLRETRVQNGALKIDQVKISFVLDPASGRPKEFYVCENKAANQLIEEFMLLANAIVAEWIYEKFPDLAFLRCHEPPKPTMMNDLQKNLEKIGIFVDISSAGAIQKSLNKYKSDDYLGQCRMMALNHLFAKPMQRARYFCASRLPSDLNFNHFALSIPMYTHFTSPIRRYADIMVHRLLAASLNYIPKPNWDADEVAMIAETCNRQKYAAKRAGEASCELYLAHLIEAHKGDFIEQAVVVDVKEMSVDAIILRTGTVVRVYNNRVGNRGRWRSKEVVLDDPDAESKARKLWQIKIEFPAYKKHTRPLDIILDIFTVVRLELTRKPKSNKLEAKLLRPILFD